jgi:hypothetical protein
MQHEAFIKVRAEEVVLGAIIGACAGIAIGAPLSAGLPAFGLGGAVGLWPLLQAAIVWTGGIGGAVAGGAWAARQPRDSHVRGVRPYLSSFRDAAAALQAGEHAQMSSAQASRRVRGIEIGGVELSRTREVGHLYAVGLPGAGKTVLLTSLIDQALVRGDRLILHDPKGDFTARYFDPTTTVMLGPWDDRAAIWDSSTDIDSPALADEFAATTAGKVDGQNKFFHEAAARILGGLIRSYQRGGCTWTWSSLRVALAGDPVSMIRQAARGDSSIQAVMPSVFTGADELTAGERSVLSVLGTAASWITNYAAIDSARPVALRFSIREWMLGRARADIRIVILNGNAIYETASQAIFGSILSTVSATVSSALMPEIGADAQGGFWCILDEFPQLGASALPQIQRIAELGRSRGVRMVTALQDESQLAARVGRDKAEPMLSVQSTRIYMRSSDKTAESVCKRIGERDVHRIETTAEAGAVQGKTKRLVQDRVLRPSDLLGLRVRTKSAPAGVEMLLHVEDVIGKLVQPFPKREPAKAQPLVESEAWRIGALPADERNAVPSAGVVSADDNSPANPNPDEESNDNDALQSPAPLLLE